MENKEIIDTALMVLKELNRVSDDIDMTFKEVKFTINQVECEATKGNCHRNEFYLKVDGRNIRLSAYNDLCRNNGCCLSGCGRCL